MTEKKWWSRGKPVGFDQKDTPDWSSEKARIMLEREQAQRRKELGDRVKRQIEEREARKEEKMPEPEEKMQDRVERDPAEVMAQEIASLTLQLNAYVKKAVTMGLVVQMEANGSTPRITAKVLKPISHVTGLEP